jgi:hypothetical protein
MTSDNRQRVLVIWASWREDQMNVCLTSTEPFKPVLELILRRTEVVSSLRRTVNDPDRGQFDLELELTPGTHPSLREIVGIIKLDPALDVEVIELGDWLKNPQAFEPQIGGGSH